MARRLPRALFAVVEARQHRALWHTVADIGAQIDQHAGHLEANLGGDAGLDRAEAEDLDRHVTRNARHLDRDGLQQVLPAGKGRSDDNGGGNGNNNDALAGHAGSRRMSLPVD